MSIESAEHALAVLRIWLVIFTSVVAIGLVLEYKTPLYLIARGLLKVVALKSTPFYRCALRKMCWHFLGALLVTVGVAGEFIIEYEQNSAEANFSRASASARDDLNARTAQAELLAKGFEAQIADANKQAAEANRIAESEKLARVELEKQLQPRRLTKEQKDKLSKLLHVPGGANIAIASSPFDAESQDFTSDLTEAFKAANWRVIGMMNLKSGHGMEIATQQDASGRVPPDSLPAMTFIKNALSAVGIACKIAAYPSDDHSISSVGFEKRVLYLLVYHKPETEPKK